MNQSSMPWDLRTITKYSSITSEKIALYAESGYIDQDSDVFADMHFELELGIVLEGALRRDYDGSSIVLEPGEVWFTNIWEPHGYTIHRGPCSVMLFMIHPQMLQEIQLGPDLDINWNAPFVSAPEFRPGKLTDEVKEKILAIASHAKTLLPEKKWEMFDMSQLKQIQLRLAFLRILVHIHSCWCQEEEAPKYLSAYKLINPAIEALFNTREFISTEEAAQCCGLSTSSFNSKFKELMGVTFSNYSMSYRIKGVASQLIHTTDPLKKIVADWGFTDESHLHRAFTKEFKMSPGKYRSQYKQG